MYATAADPNEKTFSWDTDEIPFVVDNSATAIISNNHRLLHGHLTSTRVTLETADEVSTKTQLVGIFRLVLTNNKNENYTYDVPGCVFDPATPINILGVPALARGRHHYKIGCHEIAFYLGSWKARTALYARFQLNA